MTEGVFHDFNLSVIAKQAEKVLSKYIDEKNLKVKPWDEKICEEFSHVSLDDLLFNDYFLGFMLKKEFVYTGAIDTIYEIWDLYKKGNLKHVVLLWAIGGGKTTVNALLQWLQWYDLVTLAYDFRNTLKLLIRKPICQIQMSKDETKARRVTFESIYPLFQCPFNRDYFPPDPRTRSRIEITRNSTTIFPGTGVAASAQGYDIFGACLDEAATMRVVQDSKYGETSAGKYDTAFDVWNEIDQRVSSRFSDKSGMIVMISQRKSGNEFVENFAKRIESGKIERGYVKKLAFWDCVGWNNKKFFPSGDKIYMNTKNYQIIDNPKEVKELEKRKMENGKNSQYLSTM
ncbi:MAG: hypothetical protein H8D45_04920 [Bacteroidetes bacterium]|nr:hypothetical protein [Bacteroidota bacterium]